MSDAKSFLIDDVKVSNVDTYRSKPEVNMACDMVRVTIDMPLWLWRRSHKYLGVDERGWPLPEED